MEVVSETIRDEAKTLPMEILGSDEGAICSPLLSKFPQSPKNPGNAKQDKGVAQCASIPPSEGFGQWDTHMAVRTRKTMTAGERKKMRSAAYEIGGDLLSVMSGDKKFMAEVRDEIKTRNFFVAILKDRSKRQEGVSEGIRELADCAQSLIDEAAKVSGVVVDQDMNDLMLQRLLALAFIGAMSLISEEDNGGNEHDALRA